MISIYRTTKSDQGTGGVLIMRGFNCWTRELPDRGNKPFISCIPEGVYDCAKHHSNRFGNCFHVMNVWGRTHILIHSGNVAGDIDKGFKTHSKGCILLGKYTGSLWNQRAVLCSRPTVRDFYNKAPDRFKLQIKGVY